MRYRINYNTVLKSNNVVNCNKKKIVTLCKANYNEIMVKTQYR